MRNLIRKFILWKYRRKGLRISSDCRLISLPDFGSEPYLISIGRHVTITSNVTFITHDGSTWVFRERPEYRSVIRYGRITIHDNCFIGYGATIMPGVSIGPNAIVGACSLVTRDVPPNSVAAGVPAKVTMSIKDYADKCRSETPDYDRTAYRNDKTSELLRLFPRPW
jgi:acetyltransferase-like isoleucine patch superfamily enzyme